MHNLVFGFQPWRHCFVFLVYWIHYGRLGEPSGSNDSKSSRAVYVLITGSADAKASPSGALKGLQPPAVLKISVVPEQTTITKPQETVREAVTTVGFLRSKAAACRAGCHLAYAVGSAPNQHSNA
jgi:hypothetical protein